MVDATGRRARSLTWLADLGFEAPRTSVVEIDTRYVSRVYDRTGGTDPGWKAAAVVDAPATRRLAMALPLEHDRWIVVLGGFNGEVPPTDEAARLAYARSFPSPVIVEAMATSEPVGEQATFRFPANLRRHVERLRRFPLGWCCSGTRCAVSTPSTGRA